MRLNAGLLAVLLLATVCIAPAPAMAADDDDKPVLFINTRSDLGYLIAINSSLRTFAQQARKVGYDVDHGLHPEISDEMLEGIDTYILAAPNYPLTGDYQAALKRFMRNGGKVIFMSWRQSDGLTDTVNINSFIEQWGLRYETTEHWKYPGREMLTVPKNSDISGPRTVDEVSSAAYTRLTFHKNKKNQNTLLVDENKRAIAAVVSRIGKKGGELYVVGELAMFADDAYGGTIQEKDNIDMTYNFLMRTLGSWDLDIVFLKPLGSGYTGGSELKVKIIFKNRGTSDSSEVDVELYLTDDGTLDSDARPAETIKRLKRFSIPAVKAGKRLVRRVDVTLPGWLGEGKYKLVAVVDPKGKSADTNDENNSMVAGKVMNVR